MVRKRDARESEVRKGMRGGAGEVTIRHYFRKDEFRSGVRLCAELVLPPGAGIGLHEHALEDEIFIVQQGKGTVTDRGADAEVGPGDAIVTGGGDSHAVRNTGTGDLVITAVIVQYPKGEA